MVLSDDALAMVARLRSRARPKWPDFSALHLDFDRLPTRATPPTANQAESLAVNPAAAANLGSPLSSAATVAAPKARPSAAPPFSLSSAALAAVERAVGPQPSATPAVGNGEFTLSAAALAAAERAVQTPRKPAAPTKQHTPSPSSSQQPPPPPPPPQSQSQQYVYEPPPPPIRSSSAAPPSAEALQQMIAKAGKLVRGVTEEQIADALRSASYNLASALEAQGGGGERGGGKAAGEEGGASAEEGGEALTSGSGLATRVDARQCSCFRRAGRSRTAATSA